MIAVPVHTRLGLGAFSRPAGGLNAVRHHAVPEPEDGYRLVHRTATPRGPGDRRRTGQRAQVTGRPCQNSRQNSRPRSRCTGIETPAPMANTVKTTCSVEIVLVTSNASGFTGWARVRSNISSSAWAKNAP